MSDADTQKPKQRPPTTVPVLGEDGAATGSFPLPPALATLAMRTAHQAVVAHLSNRRHGNASTKTRGEVRGGGRKPWRQKGTGRARQGSIRAPHWRHGGVAFGPRKRSFRVETPQAVRNRALAEALARRSSDGDLFVVPAPPAGDGRTGALARWLAPFRVSAAEPLTVALLLPAAGPLLVRAARNLRGVAVLDPARVDAHGLLACARLLATREAVDELIRRALPSAERAA